MVQPTVLLHSQTRNPMTRCHRLHTSFGLLRKSLSFEPRTRILGSLMSQVLRTCVEILSRHKPAESFTKCSRISHHPSTYRCIFSKPRCNKTQMSYRTAICVVTGRATLVVNSASNYASGSLEPPPGSFDATRGLTSSVRGSTFGASQTTASVLSSLLTGYHSGSSQTGCDCLAAHGSCPSGLSPTASQHKWKALGRVLTIRLPCLELPPEHRPVHTSALA